MTATISKIQLAAEKALDASQEIGAAAQDMDDDVASEALEWLAMAHVLVASMLGLRASALRMQN